MKTINKICLVGSGIIAHIPGAALIANNIYILPGDSRLFYSGLQTAMGVIALFTIWSAKDDLLKKGKEKLRKASLWYFFTFLLTICVYIMLFRTYVRHDYVFPFYATGQLGQDIKSYHSFDDIITAFDADMPRLLNTSSITIVVTKILFMLLYLAAMTFLVVSFMISIIGLSVTKTPPPKKKKVLPKTIILQLFYFLF